MNKDNKELAEMMKFDLEKIQGNTLYKISSERKLGEEYGVGRQRIRDVINQLVSDGLLVKYEGKGTYLLPKNSGEKYEFINFICAPTIKQNDPFYSRILNELTAYSAKNSIKVISLDINSLDNGYELSPILTIGKFSNENIDKIKMKFKKVISFEDYPDNDDFVQIYFDHYKIGKMAAKALYENGHKKVVHIAGPSKYASAAYRMAGFLDTAKKYRMEVQVIETKMNFSGGYDVSKKISELVKFSKYSGIFAANDWTAIGLLQGLKGHNIEVPKNVSLIGVDNIPLSKQIYPALTTFSLDAKMVISECFALLEMDQMVNDNFDKRIILQAKLISRDSLINFNDWRSI